MTSRFRRKTKPSKAEMEEEFDILGMADRQKKLLLRIWFRSICDFDIRSILILLDMPL